MALITVLVVSALIRLTSGQSLMNLVVEQQTARLKKVAQDYYTSNGTLDGFFDYYIQTSRMRPSPVQPVSRQAPRQSRDIRGVDGLVDTEYRALIPSLGL